MNQTIAQMKALRQTIERRHHDDGKKARCTYAACTIRNRTRIVPPNTDTLPALLALGWTLLESDDPNIAHVRAPEWMEC